MRPIVLLVLLASLAVVPAAHADGDPASDILYFQDVYLPYSGVSQAAGRELTSTVVEARSKRYVIKVAVIATAIDLGSVPTLFNKPRQYALFLGSEIRSFYTGPLLIAMPAGFGFWQGDTDIREEEAALATVDVRTRTVDDLVRSAAAGVRKLAGIAPGHAVRDARPPTVHALAAKAQPGRRAMLRYRVRDDSGRSREVVRVYGRNYLLLANLVSPMERARGRVDSVAWRVPRRVPVRNLRFCVLARDPAGNTARPSCAPLAVKR